MKRSRSPTTWTWARGRPSIAEPGGVYDVAPASGRVIPEFPEPWFTRAGVREPEVWSAAGEKDPEGRRGRKPAPEDEQHPAEG